KHLMENKEGNLTPKQIEFAQTIQGAGTDLLNLINDVLDLSKIEAGKMDVNPTPVPLANVREFVRRSFQPVAEQKGLDFQIDIEAGLPDTIFTDGQRLQQVLKNLLSNAFKFTSQGTVTLSIREADKGRRFGNATLDAADRVLAFAVRDTGIGIPPEKQRLIFEAFQQADGTTSRKYGGTGLGLSISREIARLLGGIIRVESRAGEGSTFTFLLPDRYVPGPDTPEDDDNWGPGAHAEDFSPAGSAPAILERPAPMRAPRPVISLTEAPVPDDRSDIQMGDRTVLIIENDTAFAGVLLEMARENGFKGLVAVDGESGLALAREFRPDAVTLDIGLPGIDGWTVLDRLKHDSSTRHIPVHIITAAERRHRGLRQGAVSFLGKPVTKEVLDDAFDRIARFIDEPVRNLLVVEDNEAQRMSIVELVGGGEDVAITAVATAEEALDQLQQRRFHCVVLDLGLADMNGFTLLERIKENPEWENLPVIIYTGRDLSPEEETQLRRYAEAIIVKDVKSPERLLDETALFLHRVEADLPEQKRRILERLHNADVTFEGKKVLIVDDDVRNIFSLTSVLETYGMNVIFAENGRQAIDTLQANPDVDIVLMDVMMPEMDGYEATRAIREMEQFRDLPIIAVTAKAMKGDREKTLAAGASDYVTKPVDTEQLLSLMRVWLYSATV
ncbi:MAG TPA: response regulator, partial [Longimicrobiales bacterium]